MENYAYQEIFDRKKASMSLTKYQRVKDHS